MRSNFDEIVKLGEMLRRARERRGVSIKQASEAIKIRAEFLEALEDSAYKKLPSDVYTKGFIKNYSKYLGLNPDVSLAFYRRENTPGTVTIFENKDKNPLKKMNLSLSRGKVIALFFVGLILIFFTYLFVRISEVTSAPEFHLTAPVAVSSGSEQFFETSENKLTLKGELEVGSTLKLNGVNVDTKNLEIFEIPELELRNGENLFELIASSQFGVETKIILRVTKEATVTEIPDDEGEENVIENMLVEVIIGPRDANVKITMDGNVIQDRIEQPGTVKTFKAKQSFIIQTPRPDSVRVAINGKEETINGSNPTEWNLIEGVIVKRQ